MKKIIIQFGGTGDLARLKLIPAYHELYLEKYDFEIIALGRRYETKEEYLKDITDITDKDFLKKIHYIHYDMKNPNDNENLIAKLNTLAKDTDQVEILYYLALLPQLYESAISNIKEIDKKLDCKLFKKIIVEKPFGFDIESAKKYNSILNKEFKDEQIYRVDHYLGKEFVQNLLVMRFYNDVIQGIWNKNFIEHIQIILNETAGVDQRLGFYEDIGVVRDMVQNHILQIVTHLVMNEPASFTQQEISQEKIKVLKSIRKISKEDFVVSKYKGLGKNSGKNINTPTFTALKLHVDTFDFAGVPIYIKTGKKQRCKCSTIYIKFRNFKTKRERQENLEDNAMIITMQPEMNIDLTLNIKKPEHSWDAHPIKLNFNHADTFKGNTPEAYHQIIERILNNDKTLFPCAGEIEESWKIVEPLLKKSEKKLTMYSEGSMPKEAKNLIEKDSRKWFI